ncbi:MAG: HDOD domain-containing protein [bacterium]|nr:HDOD domain-containing protein [bacterium]
MPSLKQTHIQTVDMSQKRTQRLRQITEKIIQLPTLPTIVTQLIALVGNPRSSAREVAQLVSTDQALTAKILKVANSAFYGFAREIATVQLAIVVLGLEMVKNLGLSVTVLKRFSTGREHRLFDRQRFWEHAIGCGVAGRLLARRLKQNSLADEAFVAGVLHDIGKLILIEYFTDEFSEALELAEAEAISIEAAEEKTLGVTHAEIGGWLAEKWNLPQNLVNAIALHHHPNLLEAPEDLVLFVHMANALIRYNQVGSSGDKQGPQLDAQVAQFFKQGQDVSDNDLLEFLSKDLNTELKKAQVFRDLDEP